MNNCSERIKGLILLAAIAVGILTYALFSGSDLGDTILVMVILGIVCAVGLGRILISSALSCGCGNRRSFCGFGVLAAIGGAGGAIASLLTIVIGDDAGTAYLIGAAISFAFFTLLVGGVVGLIADSNNCISCGCNCPCMNDDDSDDDDCPGRALDRGGYYRR